jgi:hypothetical protein
MFVFLLISFYYFFLAIKRLYLILFSGGLSTSTLVRVSVNDVNDNFPEFAPSSYDATLASGELQSQS